MASISGITGGQSSDSTTNQSNSTATAAADPMASESTFLTLMVSELQNQDPTSPMDGTTFVTQLAQFNDVQQNLAIRQDADSISEKLTGTNSLASTTSSSSTDSTSASAS